MVKNLLAKAGNTEDTGSIPESGRSPGRGNSNPPVLLSGEFHGQKEPGGLQSMGSQKRRT